MSGRVRIVKRGRKGGEQRGREVSPARRTAYDILRRVDDDGAFAAPLLASSATKELSPEDRALCYELVLGVLRRRLWLDRLIEHFAKRDAGKLDAPVVRALRLGLYQLRFLTRIPARAAVNESVNLVHALRVRSAASFVNAVLRRATREADFDPAALVSDPLEKLSVETSHPEWLVRRWSEQFGEEEAAAFARANNDAAPVSFRVNELRPGSASVVERLRAEGCEVEPSRLSPGGWRVKEGGGAPVRRMAAEGEIYMQDEASQLVAHVLSAREGERVLDLCAAPGSKTTHIAALAGDGARVLASDLYAHRLRVVTELVARQNLRSVSTVRLDAERALPFAEGSFDRVLVDAPCTGTGTLRHNPEIRWRVRPEDIAELQSRQRAILSQAARAVSPGGRLVYSTCSVEREENEDVVSSFLATHSDFRQVTAEPAPAHALLPSGAARTWPHRDDADGFFVAPFVRAS